MKNLIIVGYDKIGKKALSLLRNSSSLIICIDKSSIVHRTINLIRKKKISVLLIAKMAICELLRKDIKIINNTFQIKSNKDLIDIINLNHPDKIILFRAGLIINNDVLSLKVPVLNIHAANIPFFGGIGAIARALSHQEFEQCASLHIVTSKIDDGEVLDVEPYQLDPRVSYCKNELIAYQAGIKLLLRTINDESNSKI